MKRTILIALFLLLVLVLSAVMFPGCSDDDDNGNGNGNGDPYSIEIMEIAEYDTIADSITIAVECGSTPDSVYFDFSGYYELMDNSAPFEVTFDISSLPLDFYTIYVTAIWGMTANDDDVTVFVQNYICNPDIPVILNGDTISESIVHRDEYGCVQSINLMDLELTDPNCLHGIEEHSATLEELEVGQNLLPGLDLTPLGACPNLQWFDCYGNQIATLDLTPLASCTNLVQLGIDDNLLTSLDLAPLGACIHLRQLNTGVNNIGTIDLTPLGTCTELTTLWMSGNGLTTIDLTPLANIPTLSEIDISYNILTSIDLTPLWDLTTLSSLIMYNNSLDSSACAGVCDFDTNHPECYVHSDCACP